MSRAIGIDLGTTFSAIAVLNEFGKAEIVHNAEGERVTPSVVYFGDDDSVVVGTVAKNSAVSDPYNVVEFIKRQMGNSDYVFTHADTEYGPEQIAAVILKKLKQDAERLLGEPVSDAVITVPAYFDDARRRATINAGKIAHLNVLRIINEPTAAALAYGLTNASEQRIMVYDLGGGTFDVTIMDVARGEITVVATDGDHMLGGNDFDDQIMLYVNDAFKREHGVDLLAEVEVQQDLRQRAEAAKKTLSLRPSAKISMSAFGKRLALDLSREQFEQMTGHLLERTKMLIESVMSEAKTSWNQVDTVLLVGGSTRMPMVPQMIERMSGRAPSQAISPDEAVAMGAAVQAGILMAQKGDATILATAEGRRLANTRVTDVTSHAFGIVLMDDRTKTEYNQVMIARNTPIPHEVHDHFYTISNNQERVRFVVLQGQDRDPANCNTIGETELEFDRPKPRGYPVHVTYQYDANMVMHCYMEDEKTGRIAELHIAQSGRMSDREIEAKQRLMDRVKVD